MASPDERKKMKDALRPKRPLNKVDSVAEGFEEQKMEFRLPKFDFEENEKNGDNTVKSGATSRPLLFTHANLPGDDVSTKSHTFKVFKASKRSYTSASSSSSPRPRCVPSRVRTDVLPPFTAQLKAKSQMSHIAMRVETSSLEDISYALTDPEPEPDLKFNDDDWEIVNYEDVGILDMIVSDSSSDDDDEVVEDEEEYEIVGYGMRNEVGNTAGGWGSIPSEHNGMRRKWYKAFLR
ncbi:hypothetical protein K504DRAFT_490015 [Pleomassaria siparia CBS 279.74]|uniref:Uncharacterized protein n=1 Tax=Pleomassaria siparia CBS 279.74 TaxID=1314801 RepID=A0A6G1KE17_9PLEO|nr:hypothetical protein K504DRAFT_490015 [Pleomassaria siparia CBS 279.74]